MPNIQKLLRQNKQWSSAKVQEDPDFFNRLLAQQSPKYLWIGCSDSRVPANQIVGLPPGDLFVHRNVANVVVHADLNCLSTIQFSVDVLQIKHIIVCGHYGCGGVLAALRDSQLGLVDNWLRHVQDVRWKHQEQLDLLSSEGERLNRLCELNVIEQVTNVCQTTVLRNAWARGQKITVHGWIYDLSDGVIQDLKISVSGEGELAVCTLRALNNSRQPSTGQ